jgi:hypothetical protein
MMILSGSISTDLCFIKWIARLDDFLKMTVHKILTHSGIICQQQALDKAKEEYDKLREQTRNQLSAVEKDFIKQIEEGEKRVKKK